jgi:hypothetical protein
MALSAQEEEVRRNVGDLLDGLHVRLVGFGVDVDPFGEPFYYANPHGNDLMVWSRTMPDFWGQLDAGLRGLGFSKAAYEGKTNRIVFRRGE